MKAWIGAALVGIAGAGSLYAQSPAFQMTAPSVPRLPPPLMPNLPAVTDRAPAAQLPGGSIPLPPPPVVRQPIPGIAGEPAGLPKFQPIDLNAPYTEPIEPPTPEPTFIEGDDPFLAAGPNGPRFWTSMDYLFWWTKRGPQTAPLVVAGSKADQFPGALDQPGTRVLFGGKSYGFNPFSGVRAATGIWFGPDNRFGFEMAGFTLEQKSVTFRAGGDAFGQPFLGRPFVNANTGAENVYFVSQNFLFDPVRSANMTGGIQVDLNSKLYAYEFNGLYTAWRGEDAVVSLIGGFRSVVLKEKLSIGERLENLQRGGGVQFLGVSLPPAFRELVNDTFAADNEFYGINLGSRMHFQSGRWGIDLTGKAAVGVIQQLVEVNGYTAIDGPNNKVAVAVPGGVYAVGSNIGRHFRQQFGIVPEGNIDISYSIAENWVVKAGYSFLFMNNVARAANQVDRNVNPRQVPGDANYGLPGGALRPVLPFETTNYWTQGVNFSLEIRY